MTGHTIPGDELARLAMKQKGFTQPSQLAEHLGLSAYSSPRRVTRWLEAENEPDYPLTIALLDSIGAINWDRIDQVRRSTPPVVEQLSVTRKRTKGALDRAEEARGQFRRGSGQSRGG